MANSNSNTTIDMNAKMLRIGQNIKKLREQKGLTQTELAEKVGLERASLSNIECGRRWPGTDVVVRIADVLGIKVAVLWREV